MEIAKKILKITPLFFVIAFFCFAGEGEKITITTYYPSPYGVYNEMKTRKLIVGDIDEDSPERGVIRFESLAEPLTGEEGDLYHDSLERKFMYYAEGSWKPLGEGEGEGSSCAWFRSATGCPVDPITNIPWEEKEVKEVGDYPTTTEGYKAVVSKYSATGVHFACKTDDSCIMPYILPYKSLGGQGPPEYCKRCFGDFGFVGIEWVTKCPGPSYARCLYEGYTPTPPIMNTYKLYYCCPPGE
ncbi:MAG: hypothetical protein KAS99_02380 [Candidatus Omnitrophica bacterium]|nr:hypothetical protein [Candidatus Omnitrophota bacterium]